MEATKTFTLTAQIEASDDLLDVATRLRDIADSLTAQWDERTLPKLSRSGEAFDSDARTVATWEVR